MDNSVLQNAAETSDEESEIYPLLEMEAANESNTVTRTVTKVYNFLCDWLSYYVSVFLPFA